MKGRQQVGCTGSVCHSARGVRRHDELMDVMKGRPWEECAGRGGHVLHSVCSMTVGAGCGPMGHIRRQTMGLGAHGVGRCSKVCIALSPRRGVKLGSVQQLWDGVVCSAFSALPLT